MLTVAIVFATYGQSIKMISHAFHLLFASMVFFFIIAPVAPVSILPVNVIFKNRSSAASFVLQRKACFESPPSVLLKIRCSGDDLRSQ